MHDEANVADPAARRRAAAVAGHTDDLDGARRAVADEHPAVRATGLAALARIGALDADLLLGGLTDPAPQVRRRACELAAVAAPDPEVAAAVLGRVGDDDDDVAEVAAWALGEIGERGDLPPTSIEILSSTATGHHDPLVREAAIASLGALGDPAGLPAILVGTADKPAVRRRAVLALAPFDGPEVDAALERARTDRDWQVREAAELLLGGLAGPADGGESDDHPGVGEPGDANA
ncbi:MAG: hypothetical protein NVS3B21_05700 [Acidimicrobiales bacterium]